MKLKKPLRLGSLLEKVLNHHSKADDRADALDAELKAEEDKAKWQLAKMKKDLGVDAAIGGRVLFREVAARRNRMVRRVFRATVDLFFF